MRFFTGLGSDVGGDAPSPKNFVKKRGSWGPSKKEKDAPVGGEILEGKMGLKKGSEKV